MKELAKEELKLLEAQHPSGYHYLKLQLKEFIHVLEEQEQEKEDQQAFIRKQQHEQLNMSCMTQGTFSLCMLNDFICLAT